MKPIATFGLIVMLSSSVLLSGCALMGRAAGTVGDKAIGTQVVSGVEWLYVFEVVSVINTDKTLMDHAISMIYGKDCSTIRYLDGDYYCKQPPKPQPPLYCYRSLAEIVCYREPNPYGPQPEVDWPPTRSGTEPQI